MANDVIGSSGPTALYETADSIELLYVPKLEHVVWRKISLGLMYCKYLRYCQAKERYFPVRWREMVPRYFEIDGSPCLQYGRETHGISPSRLYRACR